MPDSPGYKICSACRTEKPVTEFYRNAALKGGLQNQCKPCKAKTASKWRAKNAARLKSYSADWHRQRRYGLSPEEFSARVAACGNLCEVCRKPPHSSIGQLDCDHDHKTGKFRGLICRDCNIALRCEDPVILRALADYLERHAEVAEDVRRVPDHEGRF